LTAGEHDVPTVADTKARFLAQYKKPVPSIYNNVLQELIVLHHFVRFNASYKYDPIFALGLVTVYDQLFDGYRNGEEEKDLIFRAYINALQEKPEQYRYVRSKLCGGLWVIFQCVRAACSQARTVYFDRRNLFLLETDTRSHP
jgi:hypothetical protein